MGSMLNPYTPGAGVRPADLVGRTNELKKWQLLIARMTKGYPPRPLALYGLRGVGKTVLLSAMADYAEEHEWWTAHIEAGTGKTMRQALGEALYRPLADVARPSAGKRLLRALKTALSFKVGYDPSGNTWNFGVDLSNARGGGADSGVLESDLEKLVQDLSEAAEEEDDSGLAIVIDEAQELDEAELVALCAVAHKAAQKGWRFGLVIGGLPSLPRITAEAKSYAERLFDFVALEKLSPLDTASAFVLPARREDMEWSTEALQFVVQETDGYPFFVQQYGSSTWEVTESSPISLDDAKRGAVIAQQELDRGFFMARWERATNAEQEYLRAMADQSNRRCATSDVADRMGRAVSSLGPARANLIAKGLIYAPEHGKVAFTVPLMQQFIHRQPES